MNRVYITEEQENEIYEYWLKTGASEKEIADKFKPLTSSYRAVSKIITRAIYRRRSQKIKSR